MSIPTLSDLYVYIERLERRNDLLSGQLYSIRHEISCGTKLYFPNDVPSLDASITHTCIDKYEGILIRIKEIEDVD